MSCELVSMCACALPQTLEVSSAQHVPRRFCHRLCDEWRREREQQWEVGKEKRQMEEIRKEESYKKWGRGAKDLKDRETTVGNYSIDGRGWNCPRGGGGEWDLRKRSLLDFAFDRNVGSCPLKHASYMPGSSIIMPLQVYDPYRCTEIIWNALLIHILHDHLNI